MPVVYTMVQTPGLKVYSILVSFQKLEFTTQISVELTRAWSDSTRRDRIMWEMIA